MPWASDLPVRPAPQGLDSEAEPQQQWGTVALAVERETWDPSAQPRDGPALGGTEAPPLQDVGTLGRRFARPPRVPLPLAPTYRRVHSRASQVRPPTPPTPALTS